MIVRGATPDDSAAIAQVHVDAWRSTYWNIVADEVLDALSYEGRERLWSRTLTTDTTDNLIYVAESDEGKVVGFVAAGAEREDPTANVGEIYAIYLLDNYQKRGVGKELFLRAANRLLRESYVSMMLWVLAENASRGFYEALGGVATRQKTIKMGSDSLIEVAYEWKTLDNFAQQP